MYPEGKYIKDNADALGVSRPTIYRVLEKDQ
jgi:predicted DNA-binding transcriptional regulator AlpA